MNGIIDKITINHHNFCYEFSKYGPDFLLGNLRIRESKYEPCFPGKRRLI